MLGNKNKKIVSLQIIGRYDYNIDCKQEKNKNKGKGEMKNA